VRLFIAVNFDDAFKEGVCRAAQELRRAGASGSFTRPENVHLTLAFLGECGAGRIPDIRAAMERAAGESFTVRTADAGRFRRDSGDIWWIGLQKCPELESLAARLDRELRREGFCLEDRSFVPHITLGRRVTLPPGGKGAPAVPELAQRVVSFELMESRRVNGALEYVPLLSVKLPRVS
jgi:2'-5' RNA ligase